MDADIIRRQALYELLAEPDPPDLHRGYVRRLEGKPDRHAQQRLTLMVFAFSFGPLVLDGNRAVDEQHLRSNLICLKGSF